MAKALEGDDVGSPRTRGQAPAKASGKHAEAQLVNRVLGPGECFLIIQAHEKSDALLISLSLAKG